MSRKTESPNTTQRKGKIRTGIPAKSRRSQERGGAQPVHTAGGVTKYLTILKPYFPLLITFGLAALAGTLTIVQSTKYGIGVTTDSVTYIKVARSFLSGHGFTLSAGGPPLTQYPPLYPATLALAGLLASDLLAGLKWLHVFLYVANILLVGLLIYRGTARSLSATVVGLLFMLTSGLVFYTHIVGLSEVLFIFFVLTGLLIIDEYLCHDRVGILVAATILVGLAGMTRYVGFVMLGVVSLCVVLLSKSNLIKRFIHAGIVISICITPIALWIIRNMMTSNSMVNRKIIYHPLKLRQIEGAISTISSWIFLPSSWDIIYKTGVLIVISMLFAYVLIMMIKRFGIYSDFNRIPIICTLFLCLYASGLITAILFVEANLPFSNRILFPFYVVLGIAIITLVRNAFQLARKPKVFVVLALVLLGVFLIAQSQRMAYEIRNFAQNGEGFTGRKWSYSKAMDFIRKLPDHATIYSNGPEAIEFLTGRQSKMIPSKRITSSNEQNLGFLKEVEGMMRDLERSQGYLVYFDLIAWRGYIPGIEEVRPYGKLESVYKAWDGSIYQASIVEN